MPSPQSTLILGVGNLLMGDEGVGIHAIRQLTSETLPPHISLLDGGTGGFHLLSLFQEYERIIMIDATMDDHPPGTVRLIRPRFASDFPRTLSAHDIGLRDMIETAALLGTLPEVLLIVVSIGSIEPMTMELTSPVKESLREVVRLVCDLSGEELPKA